MRLGEVEEEEFAGVGGGDGDLRGPSDGDTVAGGCGLLIDRDGATDDLYPDPASRVQCVRDRLTGIEGGAHEGEILMNRDGAVTSVAGGDQTQLVVPLFIGDVDLFVTGREIVLLGQNPDLQEARGCVGLGVEFAVADAAASGHALNIPGPDDCACTGAVLVLKGATDHVGDDLHVTVWVHAEAAAPLDDIVVDDSQGSESHVGGVVILCEREGEAAVKPILTSFPSLLRASQPDVLSKIHRIPFASNVKTKEIIASLASEGNRSKGQAVRC